MISVTQAAQSVVNTPIAAAGATVEVYRQARGGRVFTVPVRAEPSAPGQPADGLLDLKGIGLRPRDGLPPRDVHANGLLPLRHAFEELILTLLGDAVLRHAGADACVLPVYGVVDHGFDLLDPWDRSFPAGVLVRQGHRRKRGTMEFPPTGSAEHALQLRIERLLRRYGVTSVHPAGTVYEIRREDDGTVKMQLAGRDIPDFLQPQLRALWNALRTDGSAMLRFEGINIQFTQTQDPDPPQLVDFAQFRVASRFVNPLLTQVNDRPPFHWGGFLYPDSPQFVQPDPELALAAAPWEPAADLTSSQAAPIAQGLKLNRFEWLCARLAHEFRHGRISGFEVKDTLAGFVAGLTSHLG